MSELPTSGVLVVDKPSGPSSHAVVECVRRALHVRRVGHTGTLDPIATGVLPIVVGRATRLASLLAAGTKRYEAIIRLGVVTDTYDVTGRVLQRSPLFPDKLDSDAAEAHGVQGPAPAAAAERAHARQREWGWGPTSSEESSGCEDVEPRPAPSTQHPAPSTPYLDHHSDQPSVPGPVDLNAERLTELRSAFLGTFRQQPPPFSAKKIGGVPAYRLARRQRAVVINPVEVTVHELELWPIDQTRLGCLVTCSPGFYVRALAHDLGEWLGCGACLEALRRERSGAFGLESAVPLAGLDAEGPAALGRLTPLGALLPELPGLVLTPRGARRAAHGNPVSPDDVAAASPPGTSRLSGALEPSVSPHVKLFDADGLLVAIAEPTPERFLHPTIVLV